MASVTVRDDVGYRTVASTHEAATAADLSQCAADEGPCLDAVREPSSTHRGFPTPAGLRSPPARPILVLGRSSRIASPRHASTRRLFAGSLNSYAGTPDAFDAEAQEIGLILAAHASVAAGAMRNATPSRRWADTSMRRSRRETSSARPRAS